MNTCIEFRNYQLGLQEIDEQHQVLFDHIANLDASIRSGDRWLVVYQTLVDIGQWSKVHFAVEESLMRICRYPHVEKHIRQHTDYVQSIEQMKQQALTEDISEKASEFLKTWLLKHVMKDDRDYADHFAGISESNFAESRG